LAAIQTESGQDVHDPAALIEKLQIPLTRFAGAEGFASLLRRALAMASAEDPSLRGVKVGADGRLAGFSQADEPDAATRNREAAASITRHLLGLLVTFIGEPFTFTLIREACTDREPDVRDPRMESAK
jgi:hypothetical protein